MKHERSSYNNDVACPVEAAMQRLRGAEGSPPPDAPRAAFPAQRFPLYAGDDINRQLRDLLQRHPDKMWPPREYLFTISGYACTCCHSALYLSFRLLDVGCLSFVNTLIVP